MNTDLELLKEARYQLVLCTLLDRSGQCEEMVNKIDKHLKQSRQAAVSGALPLDNWEDIFDDATDEHKCLIDVRIVEWMKKHYNVPQRRQ